MQLCCSFRGRTSKRTVSKQPHVQGRLLCTELLTIASFIRRGYLWMTQRKGGHRAGHIMMLCTCAGASAQYIVPAGAPWGRWGRSGGGEWG